MSSLLRLALASLLTGRELFVFRAARKPGSEHEMVTQKQVESDCLDGVRDLLLEESSKKVEVSTQNLLNVDTRDSMIQEERSTIEMNVHTETPDARKRVQARNVCDTMINRQISSSLKKREWTEMPADATSKQLWQWWVQNHHDDEEFAAAQSSHAHAPDVAPIDDASPTSEWLDGSSTWAAAATILLTSVRRSRRTRRSLSTSMKRACKARLCPWLSRRCLCAPPMRPSQSAWEASLGAPLRRRKTRRASR